MSNSFLDKNGYLTLEPLPAEKCDRIIQALNGIEFKGRNVDHIIKGLDYSAAKSNIYEVMKQKQILAIPEITELSHEPHILELVKDYLDAEPIQTQANCWWSVNYEEANYSKNAQIFHQDYTYRKFIKLFLYLNDIDKTNGCHVYVPGSFQNMITPENYRIGKRVGDDFINEHYPAINYMIGKKGTMNLVDTRGWHKGNPIEQGHRLLVQLEWCNDTRRTATGQHLSFV